MWAQGAEGERKVAAALEPLSQFGWTALHDVHWPGRPQANIDHIAIGPGGIVVIDAKNWSGSVTTGGRALRQNGYSREREVEGVAQATAAVTALLDPTYRATTRAVLCLAAHDQEPTTLGPGVTVVGRLQLAAWLATLPARLTPFDVADIGRLLGSELAQPPRPKRSHGRAPRTSHGAVRARAQRPRQPQSRRAQGASCLRGCLTAVGAVMAAFLLFIIVVNVALAVLRGVSGG